MGVSPKYYSIRHNRGVGIIYHFQWLVGQESITALIKKHTKLNFGIITSIWAFQVSVLSSGIPRNIVSQILAIFLFLWVIYKSIKEIFLVTNCKKSVLTIFSDNKLVLNQLFMLKNLNYTVFKFVASGLVMIILVSSAIKQFWSYHLKF
jgi:hypothetical protein